MNQRPYVSALLEGQPTQFLYDSGAEVTVISENEFRKIPVARRPRKIYRAVQLSGVARNKPLEVRGVYEMKIRIKDRERIVPVFVVKNLTQASILGIDAIRNFGLNYHAKSGEMFFDTPDIHEVHEVHLAESVQLEPFEVRSVKVSMPTRFQGQEQGIIEVKSEQHPLLYGSEGLVSLKEKNAYCVVKNCSPLKMHLQRKERIGTVENISGIKMQAVEKTKFYNEEKKSGKTRLTAEREKEILNMLKINVPQEELEEYHKLILKHHDVFSKDSYDLGRAKDFTHKINLKTKDPVFVKQFKIPDTHRDFIKRQIHEWLKMGIIERANSPYNCSVFLVPKKNGSFRLVQDFRALNANSHQDRYNLKDVSECIGEIGRAGSTIFSTFDATSGFHQLTLDKSSRPYTAFTIPGLGQFQWCVSAMGLASAPSQYQRMMEQSFKGLEDFLVIYLDDTIVHSSSHAQHREHLDKFFTRVRQANLKLNLHKSTIGAKEVNYLGFRLTPKGILPGLDKLKAVRDFPPPADVRQIKQFMGLCNFFRTHIRNFSLVAQPLNALTQKDNPWKSGKLPYDAMNAFIQLKSALLSEPIVDFPRKDRPYSLIVDGATGGEDSRGGMGAILLQTDDRGRHRAIAYASRSLLKHEKNYSSFLLEMNACVWAMHHFDTYLKGRHFTLYTDHKPLEKLGAIHTKTLNRLQLAMNEFNFTIKYKRGDEMPADCLSRQPLPEVAGIEEFQGKLPQLQKEDPFWGMMINYLTHNTLPQDGRTRAKIQALAKECFFENDVLWRRLNRYEIPRTVLCVPRVMAEALVKEAHGHLLVGHNGMKKTKERLLNSYYWPNMDAYIYKHINECHKCQVRRTDHRGPPDVLHPLPITTDLNQRVAMDLFGPLKTSASGKAYVLCMTDSHSHYIELVALPNKEASTVVNAVFEKWICRYGLPYEFISDNGKEFCNQFSKELYQKLQIKHTTTSPYHPQTNAAAEVCNKIPNRCG